MAVDLALDPTTFDLIATPSFDAQLVDGIDEVEQRMRVRLRVQLGSWDLEPSLGSTLNLLLRVPIDQAVQSVPLLVKEALAPISDISVVDVTAQVNTDDPKKVDFQVTYKLVDSESAGDQVVFNDSLTVVS